MGRKRVLGALLVAACAAGETPAVTLRLWHTFGPEETAALNEVLPPGVEGTLLPFGRAQNRLEWTLRHGKEECPDLARIDATWLPGLAAAGLVREVPDERLLDGLTPAALDLLRWGGRAWGLPQAIDGLVLIYDGTRVEPPQGMVWPPRDLDTLERAAALLRRPGRWGISVRADGYWFVPFLRAAGADVLDPEAGTLGVDTPEAAGALRRYAALAAPGGVAPPPDPGGDEAATEARRFAAGEVALVVGGPWTVASLERAAAERDVRLDLRVAPFPLAPDRRPAAPRGGQLYVVPACARHPAEAWALAARLTDPALQAEWSRRLGIVPTRAQALAGGSELARAFAAALERTRPLPRHPLTPYLFDDLTPAVVAALGGDATAEEALAGVERAWRRLLERGP